MNFANIRNILLEIAEIKEVYEPLAAGSNAKSPYVVLLFGPEIKQTRLGIDEVVNVMIYHSTHTSCVELARKVRKKLSTSTSLIYDGTIGQPFYDTDVNLWVCTLAFINTRTN